MGQPTPLQALLEQVPGVDLWQGSGGTVITGIADDSRKVAAGDLFVAIAGEKQDGARFAQEAVNRGAVAVLADRTQVIQLDRPVTMLRTPDTRASLARLVGIYHARDLARLHYVGVTGTNGKTTTTLMTAAVLRSAGLKTASLGTLGVIADDGTRTPGHNTTPGPLQIVSTIQALADSGHQFLVAEVSSAGIMQHRTTFLPFLACVFTNLSPEHLETHGSFEAYRRTKISWFHQCNQRARRDKDAAFSNLVNLGDAAAGEFLKVCSERTIGFFLEDVHPDVNPLMDDSVRGFQPRFNVDTAGMDVFYGRVRSRIQLKLGGRFNLLNALAAAGVGFSLGIDPYTIARGLESVQGVPGRFERVPSDKRRVLVDYAHTSDGLETLLATCRPLVTGDAQLVVVFGCGGDRDNTKRARMGEAAARLADVIVITSDNPRSEPPDRIIQQIVEGIPEASRDRITVEPDRRLAIRLAIEHAEPEDLIVIAGKGHEDYQIIGTQTLHFDDREVAREVLAAL